MICSILSSFGLYHAHCKYHVETLDAINFLWWVMFFHSSKLGWIWTPNSFFSSISKLSSDLSPLGEVLWVCSTHAWFRSWLDMWGAEFGCSLSGSFLSKIFPFSSDCSAWTQDSDSLGWKNCDFPLVLDAPCTLSLLSGWKRSSKMEYLLHRMPSLMPGWCLTGIYFSSPSCASM